MKTRTGKIQLVLFSLLVLTFASVVNASTYTYGVSADDEWTLTVTKKDTALIEEAYGMVENWEQNVNSIIYHQYSQNEAFHELGAQMKIKIQSITEDANSWVINIQFYDWVTGNFESPYDIPWSVPKDPAELYWNTEVFFVGTPVSTYLENMNYITNYDEIASTSGNVVTVDLDGYLEYVATYADDGRLTKFEMKYEDGVMYEISEGTGDGGGGTDDDDDGGGTDTDGGSSRIPGFDILMLIGITSIVSSALIRKVYKKKR